MKHILFSAFLISFLILPSCLGSKYDSPNFSAKARHHKVIAVLPAEIIYQGKIYDKLTAAQKIKLEEAQSRFLQEKLQEAILNQQVRRKNPVRIDVMDAAKVNNDLAANGISIKDTWSRNPDELAKLLGVDAVVKPTLRQNKYMSNLASYGIDLGTDILEILINNALPMVSPNATRPGQNNVAMPDDQFQNLTRTATVDISAKLINASDGVILWNYAQRQDLDWQGSIEETVLWIIQRAGKQFPYRRR